MEFLSSSIEMNPVLVGENVALRDKDYDKFKKYQRR